MRQIRRNAQGFTIVELLIVIVVIAILAAITVVAFNGMQARAENTKTINGVAGYVRAFKAYSAANDRLPVTSTYVCLGEATSACATVPSGTCSGIGSVSGNTTFLNDIKTQITTLPVLSDQTITCSTTQSYKGAIYFSSGDSAQIWYFLKGDVECGSPGGLAPGKSTAGSATRCYAILTK